MHIRSKDTVGLMITGKDKGQEGKVLVASPKTMEGVAVPPSTRSPRQQGVPGGIIKKEAAIDAN